LQVLIAVELRRSPAFDTRLPRRGTLRAKVPGVSRNFEVAFARKARKEQCVVQTHLGRTGPRRSDSRARFTTGHGL